MASTILHLPVVNDSGTPAAPVGNGTQLNAAFFQQLEDNINEFFTRSAKTVGGVWTWESFGAHLFSSSGSGANSVRVRNTGAGASHKGALEVMADAAQLTRLEHLSSSFTPSGVTLANMGRLTNNAANGLSIETTAGLLRLVTTGGQGLAIHGSSLNGGSAIFQTGGAGSGFNGIAIAANIKDFATSTGATAGTQGNAALESWLVDIGGFAGTSGPFIADSFSINRRAAAGSWSSLLTLTTSGLFASVAIGVGNGTAAAPTYGFINDPDCGLFRVTTDAVGMATAGVLRTQWRANGTFRHDYGVSWQGILSPSALPSGTTNDWSPSGLETAYVVRVTTDAANSTLGGIDSAAMNTGQEIKLVNVGAGNLVLSSGTTSSAANRFGLATDRTVLPGRMCDIWYDASSSRWRVAD